MLASAHDNELDHGPASAAHSLKHGLDRYCALTRTPKPIADMIRFVVGPDGEAVPDLKRKLPGRGIWITASRQALDEAIKRKVFARGFKREVRIAADLPAATERLLERAALDALAIVAKSGHVVSGFAKVEAAIGRDDLAALIHAADGAGDGKRKIEGVLRRQMDAKTHEIPVIDAFTSAQLDLALSRQNVVHAALLAGPVSDTFLARTKRLQRFRTGFSTATAPTQDAMTAPEN